MKHQSALILIGFLTIGAACGCGAHDGSPTEAGLGGDGTGTSVRGHAEILRTDPGGYVRNPASDARDHEPSPSTEGPLAATVYVSPSGSDGAAGTYDAPVLTLATAIRLAAERGHAVVVKP